jgi:RimJ/RimL family protein N-acetyltransferase
MLRYIYGQDEIVAGFVAAMIPQCRARGFGRCRAIGVADADNELIAGWVYHHMAPEAGLIDVSAAALPGRQWAPRETWRVMYDYPFMECGAQMVIHTVLASNERVVRMLEALGCELTGFPRLYGRHEDGIVCSLTDDAWRANPIFQRVHRQAAKEHREAA